MSKSEHAAFIRSPLRRRLETAIHLVALLFFTSLGAAIYQNVSKGTPPSPGSSAPGSAEHAGSSDARMREAERGAASPNEPTPGHGPLRETKPSGEGPSATEPGAPPGGGASPTETKPNREEPGTTGTVKTKPVVSVLSPAELDCEKGAPTFWAFANVEFVGSTSGSTRVSSLVTSCRISAVTDSPAACQNAVIVGVGVASSRGIDATERARALRRGINLASALKKDLQARCATSATVAAYVLNLGRYNDEQQRDGPDQRKVIALVATGSEDADKAATEAAAAYAKSDAQIAHYPICELYKLEGAGEPMPVATQRKICGDQTDSTLSQR
jgi:hypothetical protein